ncbi:MAG: DUF1566 domain-containing protein [Wenzhouxiangella sp.]|jgi:hypothetical protein|nr:DUF1566 domain-containing protein [Wenzhouxiangella sp.]
MRVLLLPLFFLAACAFAQTSPLNDTGQTQCFEGGVLAECAAANTGDGASHPRQDGRFGRDAQAGEAGFDFTKICYSSEAAGSGACPEDPPLGTGANDWACTRDNVTGLVWEVKTPANAGVLFTFAGASDYATNVTGASPQLCGAIDWRVPTRRELLSIVHHGRSSPAIDTTFFPNSLSGFYWSSDSLAPDPADAWAVGFDDGSTAVGGKTLDLRVRLVSGNMPPEPNPRFVDSLDGTVTDPATGLMWDRCSWGQTLDGTNACTGPASSHSWQAALGIAITANTANHRGYYDWRLPNRTELEALVNIAEASGPTIDEAAFPDTPPGFFRSSTVPTLIPTFAWYVNFSNGGTSAGTQSNGFHVRLVRSGQSFDALAAGIATEIVMSTQPGAAARSGVPFPQQPIVEVRDANGNPVQATGTDITAAIASGGGTLTGTTTVATAANGRATFTDLAISGSVGDRTLSFSAGSLTPATSGTITLSTVPAAPIAVIATAGSAQATVYWTAPTDTGGLPITGYAVTGDPGGSCSVAGNVTECTITGLTNGTGYTFAVIATNAQGNSPASAPSNTVVPSELLFRDRFEGD